MNGWFTVEEIDSQTFAISEYKHWEETHPVCGSAHCQIADYWSGELGKPVINAYQASKRGGHLKCELLGSGRIAISGEAVLVSVAELAVELE